MHTNISISTFVYNNMHVLWKKSDVINVHQAAEFDGIYDRIGGFKFNLEIILNTQMNNMQPVEVIQCRWRQCIAIHNKVVNVEAWNKKDTNMPLSITQDQ